MRPNPSMAYLYRQMNLVGTKIVRLDLNRDVFDLVLGLHDLPRLLQSDRALV